MVYATAGVYPVTLIVTNANGCSDTVTKNVTVYQSPDANGSISSYNGCAPHNVNFTNNSLNATSYTWDFGDGNISTQTSPSHVYTTAGTYQVILIAGSGNGCVDTMFFVNPVIIGTAPNVIMSTSASAGCAPLDVIFTSQSTGLTNPSYLWDFGNGQTSILKDDSTTYTSAGTYNVSLVIFNQGGCVDSASSVVNVFATPQAIATTTDTAGCAPYAVTFSNTSVDATGYTWDFGDGSTSTQTTPVHTYTVPGIYTISLTASGPGGCSGQLTLPVTVHVKAMPTASFTTSAVTGCTPMQVTFNNTSSGLVNPTWQWSFGNGVQSQQQNPSVTYNQEANFPVLLTVTNDEGCIDTATATIDVNLSPVANAGGMDTSGCIPHTINYNSNSLFADSLIWQFGNGAVSNSVSGTYTYTQAGTFQPVLIALTNEGCADTLALNPVTAHAFPVAGFTVNQPSGCPGSQFSFTNQSSPGTGLIYQWTIAGISSTAVNPVLTLSNPGYFDVSLIVTSAAGCSDTMVSPFAIQVYDSLPPPVSPILSVSVLNNSSVEITWLNNPALDLGAYVLYRFNQATSVFQEIYRDTTPNNSSMTVTSTYIDNGLNTLNNVYTYKLQTLDLCAHTLPMSSLTAHTTINVSAQPRVNDIRVSWTRYLGCPVDSYQVNRVHLISGTSLVIATVPGTVLTYTDQGFQCPEEYSYRIKALSLCGTSYYSWSDTAEATPANPLANQKVEIIRSTVVNDKDILTEWMPPILAPGRVAQYDVMRSKDNIHFTLVASVPPSANSYIDYNSYVHDEVYFYRVDVISDCMIAGVNSNTGANILLRSDWMETQTKLWWTPYTDWDTDVDYYIIEKYDRGIWQQIKTVNGNIVNTIVDE